MTIIQSSSKMSKFIHELSYESIPSVDVETSKKLILDLIGVSCIAHEAETTEPFIRSIDRLVEGEGDTTVIGLSKKYPTQYAALLNGVLAHTSDFDDTNILGGLHPGAVVIPAVLSAAQQTNANGKEFITSVICGYEIMCRVGAALGRTAYDRGFHPTSVAGIFGAVAAVCKIKKSEPKVIDNALGLALSLTSGTMQYLENGSWNKRLHPGFMAHHAFLCVTFAEEGVLGAAKPFSGTFGLLKSHSDEPSPEKLESNLGEFWYTSKTAIKPYPSCRFTHGAIDAVLKTINQYQLSIDEINKVEVEISRVAFNVVGQKSDRKVTPKNVVDAQFSIYFQTAAALVDQEVTWRTYTKLESTRIQKVIRKIEVSQNHELTDLNTIVKVTSMKGTFEEKIQYPKGEPENQLTWEEVKLKYNSLAIGRLGMKKSHVVSDILIHLDNKDKLTSLYEALSI